MTIGAHRRQTAVPGEDPTAPDPAPPDAEPGASQPPGAGVGPSPAGGLRGAGADAPPATAVFVVVASAALFIGSLWALVNRFAFGESWPQGSFLHTPVARFSDFYDLVEAGDGFRSYSGGRGNYLPTSYVLVRAFGVLPEPLGLLAMVALCGAAGGFLIQRLARVPFRSWQWATLFLVFAASYPLVFAIDRGNVELVLFAFVGLAVYAVQRRHYRAAALWLSIATAMKGYPIIFVILLVRRRQYRWAALAVGGAALQVVAGLYLFSGGWSANLEGFRAGLEHYHEAYVVGQAGLPYSTTLFGAARGLVAFRFGWPDAQRFAFDNHDTFTLLGAVVLVVLIAGVWHARELWKQAFLLSAAVILLPLVSADYKLLYLFIPLWLLLGEQRHDRVTIAYAVLFALAIAPKPFGFLNQLGISTSVVLNPLLLLIISAGIVAGLFTFNAPAPAPASANGGQPPGPNRSERARVRRRRRQVRSASVSAAVVAVLAVTAVSWDAAPLPGSGRPGRSRVPGYWLATADGGIYGFGDVAFAGSSRLSAGTRIVSFAATPNGKGYWLAGSDGSVFAFGEAAFHGSVAELRLDDPIVAIERTPSGGGYWLLGADGGVFAFGDADFYGSRGLSGTDHPVVAMTPTPTGQGYWLVASDGSVYRFGDARFRGSPVRRGLRATIVDIASTPTGRGYWLAGSDGGVFAFGDAAFHGSAVAAARGTRVAAMAATPTGDGYWVVATNGGVSAFGDARFFGSARRLRLDAPVVAFAYP